MTCIGKPGKILIIQLRRIGDVVLTTPAVKIIKKNHPQAKIDFLVEPPANEVLENNPCLNKVYLYEKNKPVKWIFEIRKNRYDWVIDFLGNPRSEVIAAFSGAKIKAGPANVFWKIGYNKILAKITKPNYAAMEKIKMLSVLDINFAENKILPEIYLTDENIKNAKEIFRSMNINLLPEKENRLIAISPVSRKITRRYPQENWVELIKLLLKNSNCKIIVLWGPGEKETADKITLSVKNNRVITAPQITSLKDLAAVLKQCSLLITNCNGTKHIATAVGIPTLTIHGASSPTAWMPVGYAKHQYVKNRSLNCVPCAKNTCPKDTICLKNLPAEIVYDKAAALLK